VGVAFFLDLFLFIYGDSRNKNEGTLAFFTKKQPLSENSQQNRLIYGIEHWSPWKKLQEKAP